MMDLQRDMGAHIDIQPNRIFFRAPTRHFDEVNDTIEAVLNDFVSGMVPIEREISDKQKMSVIEQNMNAIKVQC